jgi:uncharacterized protein
LLDEGAPIPFIARYRKEVTLNLDEEQLRAVQTMYYYETNLFNRKEEVLRLIEEKGKLTPELAQAIQNATQLKEVDDLYLPYREKKKTRATIAQAKGLDPWLTGSWKVMKNPANHWLPFHQRSSHLQRRSPCRSSRYSCGTYR